MFKCVVCGKDAEYIYFGMSLCGEHFRGFPKPSVSQSASPRFNLEEELTRHEWKGHRLPDGSYAMGSLDWGWDYKDNFTGDGTTRITSAQKP